MKGSVYKEIFVIFSVILGLAAIAYPAYRDYMRRDYYKEIVQAIDPFKAAVGKCFATLKTLNGCNAGVHTIPPAIKTPKGAIASITVINGIVTAIPVAHDGIYATDVYVLTPKITNNELEWVPSGKAIERGFVG